MCMEYGCLPRCTECGGGKMKMEAGGGFKCPGYMDDADYVHCGRFTNGEDLTFAEWGSRSGWD